MQSLKFLLIALCIFSVYQQKDVQFTVKKFIDELSIPNNWGNVEQYLDSGPMNNYFDYPTTIELYTQASVAFPELVIPPFEFGRTFLNNTMYACAITLKKGELKDHQGILFDSLHHGREMLSLSMQIYSFAKLISDYKTDDQDVINLLKTTVIWFIPAVNVDGLIQLKSIINDKLQRDSVRKNFNRSPSCPGSTGGVDLNRNYDEHFAYDEAGSSSKKCQDDYRGEHAFSEPETQAMKKFIDERKHIKIAFNLHTYGNMWIRPINYSNDKQNKELKKMHREYHIFQEFDEEAQFAPKSLKGNAVLALESLGQGDYVANGEATDWMLLKKKIIALSPEIGEEATNFFPVQHLILKNLQENYPPISYMMLKILFKPKQFNFTLQGVLDLKNQFIQLDYKNLKSKFLKKYKLKPQLKNTKLKVLAIEVFNSGIGDLLKEDQEESYIELGFQHLMDKNNPNIETGNPDDKVQDVDKDQNMTQTNSTNTTAKLHSFHIQNVFYIDYNEDFRFNNLEGNGSEEEHGSDELNRIEQLNSKIIDFQMEQANFTKPTSQLITLEKRFRNKFSVYQIPFNSKFEGRTFRKYFVVFTTLLKPSDKISINIRINAGIGSKDNRSIYNLVQEPINIDFDGVNNAQTETEETENYEYDEYPYYYSVILLLALILMFLVLKLFRRKRDQDMVRFANDVTTNNQIEIN